MIRKLMVAGMVNLIVIAGLAQHCVYDGTTMIMLDIQKSPSVTIKKIYLIDSSGAIVVSKHYMGGTVKSDSAIFYRNPLGPDKNSTYKTTGQYFPFARDYQILALGAHDQPQPYSVVITYSSAGKNRDKTVPLLNNHVHQLCTTNQELWNGKVKPMSVIL